MWQRIFDFTRQLFKLKEQTEKNTADLKEVQQSLRDLTLAFQRLAFEQERQREKEADEREKMALRLENILLRSRQGLLTGDHDREDNLKALQAEIEVLRQENERLHKQLEAGGE